MLNAKVLGISLLLIGLCVLLAIRVPESFLTGANVENLLRRTAMYGILGIGVAYVIITSGIDLSIGSMVCLAGCLLALFLRVSYVPSDQTPVRAVRSAEKQLVLPPQLSGFQVGDQIRYFGGRRAESAIRTITAIESKEMEVDRVQRPATVVTVNEPFSRNDHVGFIARVYAVQGSQASAPQSATSVGSSAQVTIAGANHGLQARDQLVFLHATSGLKQMTVESANGQGDSTQITLTGKLDKPFDNTWVVVPLHRHQRMPIWQAVALVLGVGAALGILHGCLITKIGLQPFVVTLCGLLFYRGLSRWLVSDQPQGFGDEYDASLRWLATSKLSLPAGLNVPVPFLILLVVAVLAALFLNKTIWGRYMLALGRNRQAAEYSGIDTDRMIIWAYGICTTLAALGGMLFALDANSVSPSSFGNFFELYAIAAAVLGGCSLRGGEGDILGVVIGTALMQVLYNLINLLRISDTLQFAIIGAVILAGVIADEMLKRWATRRRLAQGGGVSRNHG